MVLQDKFLVKVWNEDKTEYKETKFKKTQEVIDFLGITRHAYNNFMLGRTKKNTPKTAFLKNVEIKRLTKDDMKNKIAPKKYYVSKHDPNKKINELFNKIK